MTVRRRDAAVDAAILAALVAAGAALRWPYLMAGIWRDEGSTYFETVRQSFFGVFGAVARGELNPPGYFLFERAWTALAGGGEVALKLPSVVFGLALIVATYALGRRSTSPARRGRIRSPHCWRPSPSRSICARPGGAERRSPGLPSRAPRSLTSITRASCCCCC